MSPGERLFPVNSGNCNRCRGGPLWGEKGGGFRKQPTFLIFMGNLMINNWSCGFLDHMFKQPLFVAPTQDADIQCHHLFWCGRQLRWCFLEAQSCATNVVDEIRWDHINNTCCSTFANELHRWCNKCWWFWDCSCDHSLPWVQTLSRLRIC